MATAQKQGIDVFTILRTDHQNVTKIMNALKQADEQKKKQLFDQLQTELENHMAVEEQFLYPRLEDIDELSDLIQDSLADHDDIREIIQEMNQQEFNSESWQENCQALEDSKEDHVDREEQEVFPQAMELIDRDELARIGEQIATEKRRLAEQPPARGTKKKSPQAYA